MLMCGCLQVFLCPLPLEDSCASRYVSEMTVASIRVMHKRDECQNIEAKEINVPSHFIPKVMILI